MVDLSVEVKIGGRVEWLRQHIGQQPQGLVNPNPEVMLQVIAALEESLEQAKAFAKLA